MRELISPTLFLVARLGLFFAVVGWVAGVLFAPEYKITTPSYSVCLSISSSAWCFDYEVSAGRFTGRVWRLPGLLFSWSSGVDAIIRHWLIVTIFALLNGMLMWVYRKRGKELAADE